jgi:hypothetical protein
LVGAGRGAPMIVSVCPDVVGVSSIQSGGTHSPVEGFSVGAGGVGALLFVGPVLLSCANKFTSARDEMRRDDLGLRQRGCGSDHLVAAPFMLGEEMDTSAAFGRFQCMIFDPRVQELGVNILPVSQGGITTEANLRIRGKEVRIILQAPQGSPAQLVEQAALVGDEVREVRDLGVGQLPEFGHMGIHFGGAQCTGPSGPRVQIKR